MEISKMASENFFNIDNPQGGIPRTLAEGITTNVFPGDQAMVSVVRLAPNSVGSMPRQSRTTIGVHSPDAV